MRKRPRGSAVSSTSRETTVPAPGGGGFARNTKGKRGDAPADSAVLTKAALAAGALSLLLFLLIAFAVLSTGGPLPIDRQLAAIATGWRNPVLDQIMIDASYLCTWQVLGIGGILVSVWLVLWKRPTLIAMIWVSLLGNALVVASIKHLIGRARPDQALALLPASGFSFPSGHTFSSVAFYGLLGVVAIASAKAALRWVLALGIVLLTGLVGVSRVYLGAHWPTDVMASWALGIAWLSLFAVIVARDIRLHRPADVIRPRAMWISGVAALGLWVIAIAALAILNPAVRASGAIGDTAPHAGAPPGQRTGLSNPEATQ